MRPTILNRYILREILPGFAVNILLFTLIILMARIMELANLVISKGVSIGLVIGIILLLLPKILALTLPMATLLAVLTGFLRLSADSELTVLRASGLSIYQLSPPVLLFGSVVAIITGIFSTLIAPESSWRFKEKLLDLAKARADLAIVEQTFIREFPGLTLYIGQLPPGSNEMGQVFIHDSRSETEDSLIVAESGLLGVDREAGTLLFRLRNGVIDRVYPNSNSTDSIFFDVYELKVSPGAEVENETEEGGFLRGRSEIPTSQLTEAALAKNDEATLALYEAEWHRRWALPFTTFIMAMIGLPLGASFRVRGRNFALLMAMGVFITYYVLFSAGWAMAKSQVLPPWLAVWASNIILAVLSAILLRRINRSVPVDPIEFLRRLITGTGKPRSTSRVKS